MMTPNVVPMNQPGNSGMGMGPNQAIAQRQQAQNPSTAILNQAMNAGNMSALQQMKQNQQQLGGTAVFSGLVQQRQQQVGYLNCCIFRTIFVNEHILTGTKPNDEPINSTGPTTIN